MKRGTITIWIFPIISCSILLAFIFGGSFGKPVTGLVIGFIIGTIIGLLIKLIFDDILKVNNMTFYSELEGIIRRPDDLLLIPTYFFKIWYLSVHKLLSFFVKFLLITVGIIILLVILIRLISSGY